MFLDSNPRIAWGMSFETGIRTQAMVDLAESQQAQPKASSKKPKGPVVPATETRVNKGGPGAAFGDESMPVYSVIKRMERDQPTLAAVGHWLCVSDTGIASRYLDEVADAILEAYIALTPGYDDYRQVRKERIAALIQARMMQDRNDMDGSRPLWQPKEVAFYCREFMGVNIVSTNWKKDGWDAAWSKIGDILIGMESDAMAPIADVVKKTNKLYREAA